MVLSLALVVVLEASPDGGVDEDTERLRQTVVTGTRSERKVEDVVLATEVITRPQIEALSPRDLTQVLQQHPGVELAYTNRGVGIRLQGMDPAYALILIDGQRVAGRSGAFTDLARFALREVERIEIIKGPAAAMYGADAIGGVINLITRRPQNTLEAAGRGIFGTLMEGDVRGNVGSKLGNFELRGGAGYRTRNPYDWDLSDPAVSGPGIRRIDGDAEVAWQPSADLRAWLRGGYVFTDLTGVDQNETGAVFDRYQRTEQLDTWAGVGFSPGTSTKVTVRGHFGLFRDQFLVDQRGAKALDDYSVNLTRLFEALAQVEQTIGRHQLVAGGEVLAETLDSTRIMPQSVMRSRWALFAQDTWTLLDKGPRVAIEPGLRFDRDSQFGVALTPRVAIKFDPNKQLTFRGSWGLGFRPPTFSELYLQFANQGVGYIVQGNPLLTAERSGSVNLAIDYRPPVEGMVISASAWHTSVTNLINIIANGQPNPDNPSVFGYENVANAYTQGVEVTTRIKLSKGAYLELDYTALDARDVTRNRPLEGRSAHKLSLQASGKYRPRGLEAVLRGTLYSARPFYVGTGLGFANVLGFGAERVVWAPAYFDLEVQVTYAFRQWLKLFVNGYNLLNQGDKDYNPRPPRGVFGGVQLEY